MTGDSGAGRRTRNAGRTTHDARRSTKSSLVAQRIRESIVVKRGLVKQAGTIAAIAEAVIAAYRGGHKVVLFGNGGSAADAQHIAAELLGRFYRKRDALPAVSLSTNNSSLTAISNDFSFEQVFAIQIRALGNPGDVAIGLSTSGNSPNVVQALLAARERRMVLVGFAGAGGRLRTITDYCIGVPSRDPARIQESHITAAHIICELVEAELFPDS